MTFTLLVGSRKAGMDNRDAFDEGLAATNIARFSPIERAGPQTFNAPVRLVVDGQDLVAYEPINLSANQIKNLTPPHDIVKNMRVRMPGQPLDQVVEVTHTITAIRGGNRLGGHGNRDEFTTFKVNGEDFQILDDTGRTLALDADIELWDYGYGLNLVNKRADYSDEANPIPPEFALGGTFFALLRFSGDAEIADLIDANAPSGWSNSRFVRKYTQAGPAVDPGVDETPKWTSERKRYRCLATENDWGAQYDMWRWETTFVNGAVLMLVEPDTVPVELIDNTQNNDLRQIRSIAE